MAAEGGRGEATSGSTRRGQVAVLCGADCSGLRRQSDWRRAGDGAATNWCGTTDDVCGGMVTSTVNSEE